MSLRYDPSSEPLHISAKWTALSGSRSPHIEGLGVVPNDRPGVGGCITRAADSQGTPTQSHYITQYTSIRR